MATEGESGEQRQPDCAKDFNVENLSKPELRFLLSILEGELEARDLVIEALRARRKEVFVQERYGRFNIGDPFLALQRDFETGAVNKEKQPICSNPLTILEAVMAHCRKMQERMSAQLAAAERKHRKLEAEKNQLQNLEQEHKKLLARLEEERTKNKHVVLILVKECKLLSSKIVDDAQKLQDSISKLDLEKKRNGELEESLAAEKQVRSQFEAQMGAQMEKQLSEFDTEREHLRAKLSREEAHAKELQDEIDRMKKIIEQLKLSREEDSKVNIPLLRKNKDKHALPGSRSVSCQANALGVDSDSENIKKPPLMIPAKPSIVNHIVGGSTKLNACVNPAFPKPATDSKSTHNDSFTGLPLNYGKTEENGCSSEVTRGSTLYPNTPFSTSPASPSYLSQSMQSLNSPCYNSGVSPRIQAAKFKFQANANEHDQNGNTTQNPQTREISPNNRDNVVAKQMARNTVTQVLSRFTTPHAGSQVRPGFSHPIETGTYPPVAGRGGHASLELKSTSVSRVDRGNPPPIPPKKPGLLQTPLAPHHPLKTPPNIGGKIEHKPITSAPSTSAHGYRVLNEETMSKSSPQLPPKPSIDIPVASAGCVIPAIGTSQVGAWPSLSPGWNEPACSESSLVIPTTIACTSSIHPVSASSYRPCESDSILVTASGWSPPLTSLLTSSGPVPLADRSTLLHQAAAQGNVTLLSMLLNEEQQDINTIHKDGYTALYSAAANGHTDCVKLLLTSGAQVNATVSNGSTALCAAAAQGHANCAEVLLLYNADINHADGGQSPLHLACTNGNLELAKLLIDSGANKSVSTSNGWTPMHAAADTGNGDCLKLLMYYGSLGDSDEVDLQTVHKLQLKPVISAKLLNSADCEGWTAAHIAASKGFKDCLEILSSHPGLEPEKQDKCNRTVHDVATDDCKQLLENLSSLRIPLRICLDENLQMFYSAFSSDFNGEDICSLCINKHTTWDDFSAAVGQAVLNHFNTIMSDGWESQEDLKFDNAAEPGLGSLADLSFKLGNTSWALGQIFLQTPWDFLNMSKVDQLSVYMPGPKDGSLISVAYASMIPLQTLQNFLRLVEQYHNVIFQGPEGSLQEYIVDHLSCCIKNKEEATGFICDVVKVEVEPNLSKAQLVDIFINSGCLIPVTDPPPCKKKTIIILEKLEKASLLELIGDLMSPLENRGSENSYCVQRANGVSAYYFHEDCFLIGTIAKPRLQGPELLAQQHFRWVQLRWDGEPIHCLLQKVLKRKVVYKFKGKLPPANDPVCRGVDWICAVWRHLNSCLSRLGTPEALIGPQPFMSCPIVPGNDHIIMKWMSKLWNAVIVPKVEEAILSLASSKRSSILSHVTPTNIPTQGQQAVVKAALSILLNKAILHGCHIPKNDVERYVSDFKGGNFSLSMKSPYKANGKKGEIGVWRKVSTSPRKKSNLNASWNKMTEGQEGVISKNKITGNKSTLTKKPLKGTHPRSLHMDQRLSTGSDDEVDLVKELRAMCSSKSEPDITKIADLDNCLVNFKSHPINQNAVNFKKQNSQKPSKHGACPLRSSKTSDYSDQKPKPESSKVKSLLPVPRNNNRKSSSNTRQITTS